MRQKPFSVHGAVKKSARGTETAPTSYAAELLDGWNFLRRDAVLLSLCVMVAATNLLDLAWSAVLLPVWARDSGAGVGILGLVFSVWGGASMVGSFVAAAYGTRLPRFSTYVVAFLVTGLPRFVLFALGVPLWAILAMPGCDPARLRGEMAGSNMSFLFAD